MKIRNWLVTNKVFFETIAASLLSVMAILVSVVQVQIAVRQSKLAQTQLLLASDPVLILEPSAFTRGEGWVFEFRLRNIGLSDVFAIEIYENFFTSPSGTDAKMELHADYVSTAPTQRFTELRQDETLPLTLDISDRASGIKNEVFCFYRLRIDYRRNPDGKRFSMITVFLAKSDSLHNTDGDAMQVIPQVRLARHVLKGDI